MRNLRVVGNRKRDWHGCQAALQLASHGAQKLGPLRGVEAAVWRALDGDFDLTSGSGQRHPKFGANRQVLTNRVGNVRFRLSLGLPLAGAARDRWAFRDEHAVLVCVDADCKFHADLILSPGASCGAGP